MALELLDVVIDRDDRKTVDENKRSVVVIDTSPIGTVDFRMTDQEKRFLLQIGTAAALQWLVDRRLDDGPTQAEADRATAEAEASRREVTSLRKGRRTRRIIWTTALVAAIVAVHRFHVIPFLVELIQPFIPK